MAKEQHKVPSLKYLDGGEGGRGTDIHISCEGFIAADDDGFSEW